MLDEDADLWYLRRGKTAQRSFGWGGTGRGQGYGIQYDPSGNYTRTAEKRSVRSMGPEGPGASAAGGSPPGRGCAGKQPSETVHLRGNPVSLRSGILPGALRSPDADGCAVFGILSPSGAGHLFPELHLWRVPF